MRAWFWVIYLLLPLFTGILAYDYLPGEGCHPSKYEVIQEGSDGPLAWRSKETGQVFYWAEFKEQREHERYRLLVVWLGYGFLGSLAYAYQRSDGDDNFYARLGRGTIVNIIVAFISIFSMRM